jgi:hypothetical protein
MRKTVIVWLAALCCAGVAFGQEIKVAVFDPAGNANEAIREIIREEISSMIVNTENYTVLERQLINKVLEES